MGGIDRIGKIVLVYIDLSLGECEDEERKRRRGEKEGRRRVDSKLGLLFSCQVHLSTVLVPSFLSPQNSKPERTGPSRLLS